MAWLKRHLVLAIGIVIAVGAIGFGVWYLLGSMSKNGEVEGQLAQQTNDLNALYLKQPFPSRTNVEAAKHEIDKVRTAIGEARKSFTPVPFEDVKDIAFQKVLDNTIDALHKKADKASVQVPSTTYAFSFEAQKKALKLAPASFPGIAIQLAEVKTICDILFEAKINRLVSIKRARLSADDPSAGTDYVDFPMATNDMTAALISPYQAEFNCFSSELAAAIEGLYKSPHGLLVKALLIEPSDKAPTPPPLPTPIVATNFLPRGTNRFQRPTPIASTLTNVLNERLLKVLVRVDVVKPPAGGKEGK